MVFDDAALDQAVEGIVDGIFFNQGHVCCAGSRLLVQEGVADELLERLRRRIELLRVGEPLDKNTDVGAINSAAQLERIRGFVDEAAADGLPHRPARRGRCPSAASSSRPPSSAASAASERIAREEVFGPVLAVQTFRTEAEAVAKANATRYGLSAGVWTEKGSRILWMSQRLRAGRGVGEHASTSSTRRARSAASASRASAARAAGRAWPEYLRTSRRWRRERAASRSARPTSSSSGARSRARSRGARSPYRRRTARLLAHVAAGLAQGRPRRRARRPRRPAGPGPGRTAYNRGQILYRIAEVLEGRAAQLADELAAVGVGAGDGRAPTWRRRSTRPSSGRASPTSSTSSWAR